MNRVRVLSAVALLLAVVALGTVAGGLAGSGGADEPSEGLGVGSGEGSGVGDGEGVGLVGGDAEPADVPTWLGFGPVLLVLWISAAAGFLALVVFLWTASLRDVLETLRESASLVIGLGVGVALIVGIFLLLNGLFESGGGGLMGSSGSTSDELFGGAIETNSPSFLSGIVLIGAAAAVGLSLILFLSDGDEDSDTQTDDVRPPEEPPEAHGGNRPPAAAVEDPDASNEVYRAWLALRDRVGRTDRTESPEELRRRALAAGLDEKAVGELTTLFNATRYGDRPVTNDEERRAREALDALDGVGGGS